VSRATPHRGDPAELTPLRELAGLFLRLGSTAFGGPAAHIALMRAEVVHRRRWLSDERFLDLLSAANLIPGPNSTELALHIGWERRRLPGLLVAGVSFIVPAMLLAALCGWIYVRFGALPVTRGILYGVEPVILAVVAQAVVGLTPTAARTGALRALGVLALTLTLIGVHEMVVLLVTGGYAAALTRYRAPARDRESPAVLAPLGRVLPLGLGPLAVSVVTLPRLFWVFVKVGSVLFGSGYVLLSFLRAELVQRLGWLSEQQLMDAVAVGQITPGPVFTTATFIGYLLSGPRGALVATAGIFLPAFVFVAVSGPLVPKLRASVMASAFLDGVNVASLALMAVVTVQIGRGALIDLPTFAICAAALWLLLRFKPNPSWLVLGGAGAGFLLQFAGVALTR